MDQANPPHEQIVLSDRVEKRLTHIQRVSDLLDVASHGAILVTGVFLFLITISGLFGSFGSPNLVVAFLYATIVTYVAAMALLFADMWYTSTSGKQVVRMAQAEALLKVLKQEHPELVALQQLQELVTAEKEAVSGRRSFWAGIMVNLFFLLLGIGISYALARLGWLR